MNQASGRGLSPTRYPRLYFVVTRRAKRHSIADYQRQIRTLRSWDLVVGMRGLSAPSIPRAFPAKIFISAQHSRPPFEMLRTFIIRVVHISTSPLILALFRALQSKGPGAHGCVGAAKGVKCRSFSDPPRGGEDVSLVPGTPWYYCTHLPRDTQGHCGTFEKNFRFSSSSANSCHLVTVRLSTPSVSAMCCHPCVVM